MEPVGHVYWYDSEGARANTDLKPRILAPLQPVGAPPGDVGLTVFERSTELIGDSLLLWNGFRSLRVQPWLARHIDVCLPYLTIEQDS